MKKLSVLAITLIATLFGAVPAHAAINVVPAGDYSSIYTLSVETGDVYRIDLDTETSELVCQSEIISGSWITGSAYDPETKKLYWIKDFYSGTASIVTQDMVTCEQTDNPIDIEDRGDSNSVDMFGMAISNGEIVMVYVDGQNASSAMFGDAELVDGVWEVTSFMDNGSEWNFSDIAYDPVSGDLYAIEYDCQLYNVTNSFALVASYALMSVPEECPTLKIDDDQRIWFTSNDASLLNTDDLLDAGSDMQSTDSNAFEPTVFGEEFFFGPADFTASDSSLAETGIDGSSITLGSLAGVAALASGAWFLRRREVRK